MNFAEFRGFQKSLNELWKRGGRYQKAADDVYALLGRVASKGEALRGMRPTKHGESRIPHCVKYDLTDFCRLVTVQTNGYCILLFCGDHEAADNWIENHRGLVPVVGPSDRVIATYCSSEVIEEQKVVGPPGHFLGPLWERLPEHLYELLTDGLPRKLTRALEELESSVTESELWHVVADVVDGERRITLHDVFALLRNDRVVEAVARIRMLTGEIVPLEAIDPVKLPDIVDSDVIRLIDPTSPEYAEALRRFMRSARYRDWMTFMHPDQEAIVAEDFDGPAKLVGVSGSGKTCVVVKRAVRLAEKYPGQDILVLTLNRALATLIAELVTACAPTEIRKRIYVKPFFLLCRELVLDFDPAGHRRYDEVTWKGSEHVDEIWQEYYRCETNNFDARVFQEVHDSLLARGWNAERYLREEVDWLRSALKPDERRRYLDIERKGRTVALTKAYRERILDGCAAWEEKMGVVGVVDALGIAQALASHIPKINESYRCILVDEVQDFGNVELEIIRSLAAPAENDLFLCGDAAQAVTSKYQLLREAGIAITKSRSRQLSLNYRNSRDVLAAAYEVLLENLTAEMMDREDFEVLDPEYSAYSASTPLLLEAKNLEEELRGAFAAARDRLAGLPYGKACIAVCGFSLYELSRFGQANGVPVLDGTTSLEAGDIFLSDLEQTKGFEFDMVCIVNCSEGVLPDYAAPQEERFRDLAKLYVAMTRAKSDLLLSWSASPSPFLKSTRQTFLRAPWSDYVDVDLAPLVEIPPKLESFRDGTHRKPWQAMTGEEFLVSGLALGVSTDLSAKIRALVDGRGLRKGRDSLKWRTLGSAAEAYYREPRVKHLWGPDVARQFGELIDRLPKPVMDSVSARRVGEGEQTRYIAKDDLQNELS